MAYSLCIIKDITPNKDDNLHYYYSSFATYLATVKLNRTVATVSIDNYRINNGFAKVALTSTFTIAKARTATYLVEYESDASGYHMCYYVDDIVFQSGYVTYKLSIDYWGTYISHASFKHFLVDRCNVNLGGDLIGEYLEADAIVKSSATQRFNDSSESVFSLLIVYTTPQGIYRMISGDLDAITTELHDDYSLFTKSVSNFSAFLTCIKSVGGSPGDPWTANVVDAFIIPSRYIDSVSNYYVDVYHNLTADSSVATASNVFKYTFPSLKAYTYTLADTYGSVKTYKNAVFYGTNGNKMRVNKYNITHYIVKRCLINTDTINFTIQQNEVVRDITNEFRLMKANGQNNDNFLIPNAIGNLSNVLQTGISLVEGNVVGGIIKTVDTIGNLTRANNNSCLSGSTGNAGSTYGSALTGNPLKIFLLGFNYDITNNIETYGCKYNGQILTTLDNLFNYTLIASGKDRYIKAMPVGISKVPLEASKYIYNAFNNGIFIEQISAS